MPRIAHNRPLIESARGGPFPKDHARGTPGRLKKMGGVLGRRFGVYHGRMKMGEVAWAGAHWTAFLDDDLLGTVRLPGEHPTKEAARDTVVDAAAP